KRDRRLLRLPAGRRRRTGTHQHVAAMRHDAEALQDEERARGNDDDGQQPDLLHAAFPRMRGRMASWESADCTLLGSASRSSSGWPSRARLVILAILSISCWRAFTWWASSTPNFSASSRRLFSTVSASMAAVFSSCTAELASAVAWTRSATILR